MLNGSPTPASNFFNRVNGIQRSVSYSEHSQPTSPTSPSSGSGSGLPASASQTQFEINTHDVEQDLVRRAASLRVPGQFGGPSRRADLATGLGIGGGMSFGAAGSNLSSPKSSARSTSLNFLPPAASRHPLFSHHASPPVYPIPDDPSSDPLSEAGQSGISSPPSPSGSVASSGFSPASAFLSHFSSSASLRSGPTELAPDSQGARVLDYTLGSLLGRGGFSSVRKAKHIVTGELYACKIVKRDDLSDSSGSVERFEEEIKTWKSLPRHPSLLPLLEMHRTPFATFLIMPYMLGGSLLDVLKHENGSERTARKWFPGVVKAVAAMHEGFDGFEGGMLHGDLKLDNFLVDHLSNVAVCDFYMARNMNDPDALNKPSLSPTSPLVSVPPPLSGDPRPRLARGPSNSAPFPIHHLPPRAHPLPNETLPSASLQYAPPELLRAPPATPSLAQDMWAMGVILYALLTGRLPFNDAYDPRLQMKILRGTWEQPPHLGKEWLECLCGCLDGNRDTRWDIARVRRSDAIVGWQEVKRRSTSRSRSRQRLHEPIQPDFPARRFRDRHGKEPSPIAIKPSPIGRRAQSRDPGAGRGSSREPSRPNSTFPPRSRSASGSRSRSSGRNGAIVGTTNLAQNNPDHPEMFALDKDISGPSFTRGRLPSKPGLAYNVIPNSAPAQYLYSPSPNRSSRSVDSRRAEDGHRRHGEAHSSGSHSRADTSRSGSQERSRTRDSRISISPTASKRNSRSRSRPNFDENGQNGYPPERFDRFEMQVELDVVSEEGKSEEGRGRARDRSGR